MRYVLLINGVAWLSFFTNTFFCGALQFKRALGADFVSGEFVEKADFRDYRKIEIPEKEAYAANCIWVNDTVIVPEGYPAVLEAVTLLGYDVLTVDTSEYRKLDGGLSCLSLRF